jgi:hypothetical protein
MIALQSGVDVHRELALGAQGWSRSVAIVVSRQPSTSLRKVVM